MGRKWIACLIALLFVCGSIPAQAAAPELTSQCVCVMDADTGEVLYEKNAEQELPMASVTKTMTALVALEHGDMTATTTATEEALATVDLESTRIGFVAGEQLSIDELMYCMLVYSANDAANILAAAIGGSVEKFVAMMNEKAEELGCTHTHFVNPNGLDADGHYTCARDLALIAQAANQYPEFTKYAGAASYTLPADNEIEAGWQIYTKVDMLDHSKETYDARVYAAKTGWTTKAHNTFVACAKIKDGSKAIVTLLNCPVKHDMFAETTALLNYVEAQYPKLTVTADSYQKQAKDAAKQVDRKLDTDGLEDFTIRLPKGMTADNLTYTCDAEKQVMQVSVAQDSQAAYQKETGRDGTQPLLSVPVQLKQGMIQSKQTAEPAQESENGLMAALHRLPQVVQDIIIAAVIVVGAIVLMLVLLFLLGLYRRSKKRRRRTHHMKK